MPPLIKVVHSWWVLEITAEKQTYHTTFRVYISFFKQLYGLYYMKFRRYILSIILPFWIRAGCPPRRLHLLSVRKLKTEGFQEIPVSVVTFNDNRYIVGLERSRKCVQNVRKAKELVLRRGFKRYSYRVSEITDKDIWLMVIKLGFDAQEFGVCSWQDSGAASCWKIPSDSVLEALRLKSPLWYF